MFGIVAFRDREEENKIATFMENIDYIYIIYFYTDRYIYIDIHVGERHLSPSNHLDFFFKTISIISSSIPMGISRYSPFSLKAQNTH